jgi:predicted KAP-like P-loop ATPase
LIETVIGQAVEENREVIREVLTELFPLTRRILGRFESWRDPDGWLRDLRACHPDVFDRYFLLTIPGGDIAQADLDRVLSLAGDKENLGTELRAFRQRNLLAVLLDRIRAHKGQIEASHRSSLVATLFDVGDDLLLDEPEYAFSIGADSRAYQIIESFLVDEKNPKMRGIILKRATEASTGLYLPVMVTSFAEETREENPEFMDPDDLAEVKKECVRRIRIAATSGQLRTHPRLNIFLLRWRDWSGPDEPGEWTAKLIESDDGLPAFLRSFLSKVFYEEAGGVSGVRWEMKIESMESLIPVEKLEEGVRKLDPQRLDEESRRAVTAFQIAMKRRQAGKRSEEWANDLDW